MSNQWANNINWLLIARPLQSTKTIHHYITICNASLIGGKHYKVNKLNNRMPGSVVIHIIKSEELVIILVTSFYIVKSLFLLHCISYTLFVYT